MPVVLRTRGGWEWLIKFTIQQFQNACVDKLWLYSNTANIFSSPFKDIKAGHFVLLQDQYRKDFFEDVFVDNFYLGGFLKQRYHVLCSLVLVEIVSAKVLKNKQNDETTLWEKLLDFLSLCLWKCWCIPVGYRGCTTQLPRWEGF